jgi:hypothetical protein
MAVATHAMPGHVVLQALKETPAGVPEAVRIAAVMEMMMMGSHVLEMLARKSAQAAMRMIMPILVQAVKVKMAVFVATVVTGSVVSMHDRSFPIHILRYI